MTEYKVEIPDAMKESPMSKIMKELASDLIEKEESFIQELLSKYDLELTKENVHLFAKRVMGGEPQKEHWYYKGLYLFTIEKIFSMEGSKIVSTYNYNANEEF